MSDLEVEFAFEDWRGPVTSGAQRAELSLTLSCESRLVALFIGRDFPAHLEQVRWRRRDSHYEPSAAAFVLDAATWALIADELNVEPLAGLLWAETMCEKTREAVIRASRAVIEAGLGSPGTFMEGSDPRLVQALEECSFVHPVPPC